MKNIQTTLPQFDEYIYRQKIKIPVLTSTEPAILKPEWLCMYGEQKK